MTLHLSALTRRLRTSEFKRGIGQAGGKEEQVLDAARRFAFRPCFRGRRSLRPYLGIFVECDRRLLGFGFGTFWLWLGGVGLNQWWGGANSGSA
jgi:hypothetical protein